MAHVNTKLINNLYLLIKIKFTYNEIYQSPLTCGEDSPDKCTDFDRLPV